MWLLLNCHHRCDKMDQAVATTPTTGFYGRRGCRTLKTAASRILNVGGNHPDANFSPRSATSRRTPTPVNHPVNNLTQGHSNPRVTSTPVNHSRRQPTTPLCVTSTPVNHSRRQPTTPLSASTRHFQLSASTRHFQPGDRLQDREDLLYSGCGSDSDGETDMPLSGSSLYNSRRSDLDPELGPPSTSVDLNVLVQQQQGMLLKVLQLQEDLQKQQTQFVERLDVMETTLSGFSQSQCNNEPSTKGRTRLPKGLSVSVVCNCSRD